MSSTIPLLLFAKAPIAGKVKTRLQTHCSAQQAADIAAILLQTSLEKACQSWPGDVFISTWLERENSFLIELSERFGATVLWQSDGDLGDKMLASFEQHGYPMAIMGTDAPHIKADTLSRMHELLESGQSAIGPSFDGGYYIIGLSQSTPLLFSDMPWGTSQVLELTRVKAKKAGLRLHELDALQDVDEWQDLLQVAVQVPELAEYLSQHKLAVLD